MSGFDELSPKCENLRSILAKLNYVRFAPISELRRDHSSVFVCSSIIIFDKFTSRQIQHFFYMVRISSGGRRLSSLQNTFKRSFSSLLLLPLPRKTYPHLLRCSFLPVRFSMDIMVLVARTTRLDTAMVLAMVPAVSVASDL